MGLSIFLCDDDNIQLSYFERIIINYIMINDYDMKVTLATTDLGDLLRYVDKNNLGQSLFFLDIDLNNHINGVDLAAKLRKKSLLSQIVFLTSHREFAFETLKRQISALDFIVKGAKAKQQIEEVLDTAYQNYQYQFSQKKRFFTFNIGKRENRVALDKIYFLENSVTPHKVNLFGKDIMYEFYDSLNNIEEHYSELLRVHKSYLINFSNVKSIDFKKREIYFPDDYVCSFPLVKSKLLKYQLDLSH